MLHFDGASWTRMRSAGPAALDAIWGSGANDVYAVGDAGTVLHLTAPVVKRAAGPCGAVVPIYCETTLAASTDAQPSDLTDYDDGQACAGARTDTGPEIAYRLHSPITGQATVSMTPVVGDLDLIVVGEAAGACDPVGDCLAVSQTGGTEQAVIDVTTGGVYYFIVDGYAGATGSFSIDLQCEKAR
jgi:hypothetical protein